MLFYFLHFVIVELFSVDIAMFTTTKIDKFTIIINNAIKVISLYLYNLFH